MKLTIRTQGEGNKGRDNDDPTAGRQDAAGFEASHREYVNVLVSRQWQLTMAVDNGSRQWQLTASQANSG